MMEMWKRQRDSVAGGQLQNTRLIQFLNDAWRNGCGELVMTLFDPAFVSVKEWRARDTNTTATDT